MNGAVRIMKRTLTKSRNPKMKKIAVKHMSRDTILLYRLFEEPAQDQEKSIGDGTVFSLSVTKVYSMGAEKDVVHLRDISRRRADAVKIFKTVSRACVTPTVAEEIVSDLIGALK